MEIYIEDLKKDELKVLSYWNLNKDKMMRMLGHFKLKVLSYWNLNVYRIF